MQPNGLTCHDILTQNAVPSLTFNNRKNYAKWKKDIKEKFVELYSLDVNKYVEKKQGLSYLTWSFAWAEFKKV